MLRTRALEPVSMLIAALKTVDPVVAKLRQLEQLQHVRGGVHLTAEVAIFQIEKEHLPPQSSSAESVVRFGLLAHIFYLFVFNLISLSQLLLFSSFFSTSVRC